MTESTERKVRVGVLGCGAIAQAAHFEACTKAANAELYAVCDVADDLVSRMQIAHGAQRAYTDFAEMLADPLVDAVIVATSDLFHVSLSMEALTAGKHVLCEKPIGVSVQETEALAEVVRQSGRILQVGHMKRFDPGIESARQFIADEMGTLVALKAWYCDSTHRYAVTDAVQPLIAHTTKARKPAEDIKADRKRYFMLAHGSHLVDTARYLGGEILSVEARFSERGGMHCWFVDAEFASGALGHLDLTVAVRMDWHEGFQVYGERGSVIGETYNPWLFRSSRVDIFSERDGAYRRVLGADAHFYRRQVEAFADAILGKAPQRGATIEDGLASVRAMAAIRQSLACRKPVALAEASGPV